MIARVFPSRTTATPVDELAFTGPPGLFPPDVSEVHVSVTFSWDLKYAEHLARQWEAVAPVKIGGPATGEPGGDFEPGAYLKHGYVITSRGCPNRCWFCSVWRREGDEVRELPICDGWNVLDDNLLACSDKHIGRVFEMLSRQDRRAEFTGGLEAARLQWWHAEYLRALNPKQVFFAYDTPDDLKPLRRAGEMMLDAGFTRSSHSMRCYVLVGYPKDTLGAAENRIRQAAAAGFFPMAMLYRDRRGDVPPGWRRFQRAWARPKIIASLLRD